LASTKVTICIGLKTQDRCDVGLNHTTPCMVANSRQLGVRCGRRSALNDRSATVRAGQWQELRLEAIGNQFSGFLNGELVVQASDDDYAAGRVGLWTKADSTTCFDDVEVRGV
jgi:hypothetical protein